MKPLGNFEVAVQALWIRSCHSNYKGIAFEIICLSEVDVFLFVFFFWKSVTDMEVESNKFPGLELIFHWRILIIIKVTSLFQEDNIFGTNASLTYGPRLQR